MARQLLRFTGVEIQNILLAGEIFEATKIKSGGYGLKTVTSTSQVNDGPIVIDITLDDEEIFHPYINEGDISFMLSLTQISFDTFKNGIKEGGTIVTESSLVDISDLDREKWNIIEAPILSIATKDVGDITTQFVVALAITNCLTKALDKEMLEELILSKIDEQKHKINKEAYYLGYKYGSQL